MSRASLTRWGIIATACLIGGCSTPHKGGGFSWIPGVGDRKQDAADSSPFKPSRDGKPAKSNTSQSSDDQQAKQAESEELQVAQHDVETLRLIEAELRDATPEERDKENQYVKQLSPEQVRKHLKARRDRITAEKKAFPSHPIAQASSEFEVGSNRRFGGDASTNIAGGDREIVHPTEPVSRPPRLANSERPPVANGLGEALPWNQPQNNVNEFGHQAMNPLPPATGAVSDSNPVRLGLGRNPNDRYPSAEASQRFPTNQAGSFYVDPRALGIDVGASTLANSQWPQSSPSHLTGSRFSPSGNQTLNANGAATIGRVSPAPFETPQPGRPLPRMLPNGVPQVSDVELQRLISKLETETARLAPGTTEAERLKYIQTHVYLRMLYMMSGQQGRGLLPIEEIDLADQEFWSQMLWAMNNYFDSDSIVNNSDRAAQTVASLKSAIQSLQAAATLELRNVSFSDNIANFGNYNRFKRDVFSPGQPVLVYAEIANFTSEETPDLKYRTQLSSTIDIVEQGTGRVVKTIPFDRAEDVCQNRRNDYFHSYEIDIPQNAAPGPHVLKLTVKDELGGKVASDSLNFTVR